MFHRTLHAQLPQVPLPGSRLYDAVDPVSLTNFTETILSRQCLQKASTSSTGASLDRPLLRGCGDAIHQAELRELTNANRLGRPDLICSNVSLPQMSMSLMSKP